MQQVYHSNAKINGNIRKQIQKNFSFSNETLAVQYHVSPQTISKWKHRDFVQDASCRPKKIHYALSEMVKNHTCM